MQAIISVPPAVIITDAVSLRASDCRRIQETNLLRMRTVDDFREAENV